MSGLAKAFVVINLILALFFLGAVSTLFQTQKNWRQVAEEGLEDFKATSADLQAEIERRDGTIDSLESSNKNISSQNKVLMSDKQKLLDDNGDLKTQLANSESRVDDLNNQLSIRDQRLQDKDNALAAKEDRIADLIGQASEADEARKKAVKLAQRSLLDQQELAKLAEDTNIELAEARAELEDAQLVISGYEASGVGSVMVAQPKIDGVVMAVNNGIVVLSVGRDDNVKAGYEFTIYEGDTFIGKVKVENVVGDMAGARVLFTESGQTIRAGNKASTRLGA